MTADYFILSAMPDPFAIAGLNDAMRDIMDARARGTQSWSIGSCGLRRGQTHQPANALSDFVEQSFKTGDSTESVKLELPLTFDGYSQRKSGKNAL